MADLSQVTFLFLAVLALVQVAMFLYVRSGEKGLVTELARALGLPAEEKRHWSLWHKSLSRAQAVIGQAELEGVKVVADSRYAARQLEKVYEGELRLAAEKMEKELAAVMKEAQEEYGAFLVSLEKESMDVLSGAMTAFTKRLEENMAEVEGKILKLSQEEGMRVKLEAENYRKVMLGRINEDGAEVLDLAAKIVIGKKLSLEDQGDLVAEALERAKKEKLLEMKPV